MVFWGRFNIVEVNSLLSSILKMPATMEVDLQRGGIMDAAKAMMTIVTSPRTAIEVEHSEMTCKGVARGTIILGKIYVHLSMLDMEQRKQLMMMIVVTCLCFARHRTLN